MTSEAYTTDNSTWVWFIGIKKYCCEKLCHSDDRASKYYNDEERNAILGYIMYILLKCCGLQVLPSVGGQGL